MTTNRMKNADLVRAHMGVTLARALEILSMSARMALRREACLVLMRQTMSPTTETNEVMQRLDVGRAAALSLKRQLGWPVARPGRVAGTVAPRGANYEAIVAIAKAAPERTLQSIGDEFGITRERVRQILASANVVKPHTPKRLYVRRTARKPDGKWAPHPAPRN